MLAEGPRFLVWGWFEVFRVIVEILCGGIIKTWFKVFHAVLQSLNDSVIKTIGLRFFMLFCKAFVDVL